jgi:hypothetical protein
LGLNYVGQKCCFSNNDDSNQKNREWNERAIVTVKLLRIIYLFDPFILRVRFGLWGTISDMVSQLLG